MDAATNTKVEIGCTMNVSDEHWQSIFGTKKVKEVSIAEETKEESENGR